MKLLPLVFAGILIIATPASARLGETPDQCSSRYGFSTGQVGPFTMYHKSQVLIAVVFAEGVSVKEVFAPEPNTKLSDAQISELLAANAGASRWTVSAGEYALRWYSRADGVASATLARNGELTIYSHSTKVAEIKKPTSGF